MSVMRPLRHNIVGSGGSSCREETGGLDGLVCKTDSDKIWENADLDSSLILVYRSKTLFYATGVNNFGLNCK